MDSVTTITKEDLEDFFEAEIESNGNLIVDHIHLNNEKKEVKMYWRRG